MSVKQEVEVRDSILTVFRPVTGVLGRIELPVVARFITAADAASALPLAESGDTLVSIKRWTASNMFIPGTWKHAAMVVDRDQVVEAIGTGVQKVALKDWLVEHDYAMVMNPGYLRAEQKPLVADFAKTLIGMPYDDLFEFAEKRSLNHGFYCSKVIWWCADQVMLAAGQKSAFKPHPDFGVPMILPDDLANMLTVNIVKWRRMP